MKREGGIEEINNKPIFSENPLKYVIENPYSGTETMNNIKKINEIYEMMNKGIMLQMNMFNQNLEYNYQNQNNLNEYEDDSDEEMNDEDLKVKKKKKSNKRYKESNKAFESKDLMNEQIYSLSKTSQNKQKNFYKRSKKK